MPLVVCCSGSPIVRRNSPRFLIFNCTHGRSGQSLLKVALETIAAQLQLHGSNESPDVFFDKVVFCTNVTYADGRFKGGEMRYGSPIVKIADILRSFRFDIHVYP